MFSIVTQVIAGYLAIGFAISIIGIILPELHYSHEEAERDDDDEGWWGTVLDAAFVVVLWGPVLISVFWNHLWKGAR
jgi:hypothetical protein